MSKLSDKTTIYLDPGVKKSVRYYALRDERSLSAIINDKLVDYLEDMTDGVEVEKRRNEPAIPFEQVVRELGLDIDEIRNSAQKERAKRAKKA